MYQVSFTTNMPKNMMNDGKNVTFFIVRLFSTLHNRKSNEWYVFFFKSFILFFIGFGINKTEYIFGWSIKYFKLLGGFKEKD